MEISSVDPVAGQYQGHLLKHRRGSRAGKRLRRAAARRVARVWGPRGRDRAQTRGLTLSAVRDTVATRAALASDRSWAAHPQPRVCRAGSGGMPPALPGARRWARNPGLHMGLQVSASDDLNNIVACRPVFGRRPSYRGRYGQLPIFPLTIAQPYAARQPSRGGYISCQGL